MGCCCEAGSCCRDAGSCCCEAGSCCCDAGSCCCRAGAAACRDGAGLRLASPTGTLLTRMKWTFTITTSKPASGTLVALKQSLKRKEHFTSESPLMKRLNHGHLHPLIEHPETNISRPVIEPGPPALHASNLSIIKELFERIMLLLFGTSTIFILFYWLARGWYTIHPLGRKAVPKTFGLQLALLIGGFFHSLDCPKGRNDWSGVRLACSNQVPKNLCASE